jgi:hypothetical protein
MLHKIRRDRVTAELPDGTAGKGRTIMEAVGNALKNQERARAVARRNKQLFEAGQKIIQEGKEKS